MNQHKNKISLKRMTPTDHNSTCWKYGNAARDENAQPVIYFPPNNAWCAQLIWVTNIHWNIANPIYQKISIKEICHLDAMKRYCQSDISRWIYEEKCYQNLLQRHCQKYIYHNVFPLQNFALVSSNNEAKYIKKHYCKQSD